MKQTCKALHAVPSKRVKRSTSAASAPSPTDWTRPHHGRQHTPDRHGGQSSVEYAVVCAALAFALGVGMVDSNSVLWQLLDALKAAYRQFAFALSLPT